MDLKTLERLLIDRKLGELPPDACELLDAYLAADPRAGPHAEHVDATLDFARRALQAERQMCPKPMPPLATPTRRSAPPGQTRRRTWHRRIAVAASIGLAFLLGSRVGAPPLPRGPAPPLVSQSGQDRPDAGGFWSLQRLEIPARRQSDRRQHVKWTSPLGIPQIGERS